MTVQLHPLTGAPIAAVGFRKPRHSRGEVGLQPVYPILGGSGTDAPPADAPPADAPPKDEPPKDQPPADAPPADRDKVDPVKTAELGFPANAEGTPAKPYADMSVEEKLAYQTLQSRKHESAWKGKLGADVSPEQYAAQMKELADLKAANMSDTEKAVAEAKAEGRREALAQSAQATFDTFIQANVAARGIDLTKNEELAATLDSLNPEKFKTSDGDVDTDKLVKVLKTLLPEPGKGGSRWPDNGGGKRGGNAPVKGLAAGADLYEQTHPKKS